uniref:uncharacterized protein LOC122603007 n=1 Tax=Erigeron canadensis TaxID=72917 RepID=UPI001CB8B12A|nr:uncharacterized protein LOC122603007 [Erigeron canadensis]
MFDAVKHATAGYKLPSSETARTRLLDECKHDVEKELTPLMDTWYTQGVSVVSDGWSNVNHTPLINVLAVNSCGPVFMYATDFSGVEKTGVAIAKFLHDAIEKIGATNVLQVVTDNAANCKAAGMEIEKIENSELELLKVAKTRFASHYILLRRLLDCREALATTIVLNAWREWFKKLDDTTQSAGYVITETIKNDVFWENVENILAFTKPIFLMVKFCDGEGPKMGEIYERMDNMLGEIKDAMKENKFSRYFSEVEQIVLQRWEKMTIPLHCLGFALNPKFYDRSYLEKLAPGGMPRKAPNKDSEVVNGVMEAFQRIAEDDDEFTIYRDQYAFFHTKKGIYAKKTTQADAMTMDPIDWWSTYGSATPQLAEVAIKVLSQPISSSSAERNWSTYSHIHNVKRNRLNSKRADKLVFIHSNIRCQSRLQESYKSGPNKRWDMDPESSYLEGSSARLEEMLWENLDDKAIGKGKRPRID